MTLEEALRAYLVADSQLSALVGVRVYPNGIPQGNVTWPAIAYRQVSADGQTYLKGGRSAVERDTFEIEARGVVLTQCAAVRDRLRELFAGEACAGRWGQSGAEPGVKVCGAVFRDVTTEETPAVDQSATLHRSLKCQVVVIWKRA